MTSIKNIDNQYITPNENLITRKPYYIHCIDYYRTSLYDTVLVNIILIVLQR